MLSVEFYFRASVYSNGSEWTFLRLLWYPAELSPTVRQASTSKLADCLLFSQRASEARGCSIACTVYCAVWGTCI